jgi:site-specific DNA-cytosine methylase
MMDHDIKDFDAVSLFSGGMGLDLGLERVGSQASVKDC